MLRKATRGSRQGGMPLPWLTWAWAWHPPLRRVPWRGSPECTPDDRHLRHCHVSTFYFILFYI